MFLMAVLILPLMSCVTTKVIYKTVVPDVNFPEFPIPEYIEKEDGKCVVPEEWIIQLSMYKIRIKAEESAYNAIKKMYEVTNETPADVSIEAE